ncbi:hypothetical protein [Klebsiella aerogenes]|uniref:hypothetical protein n=1 Tax=Klebsiella aerogenes TaxID=548 RepID=UPI0013D49701|nr:hypothetical protein [Klebsiella aerogenes]
MMLWFDAMKVIENGGKIVSPRLPDGSYVAGSQKSEGGLMLMQADGSFEPWRPSGADQLSDNWELKDN